LVCETLAFIKTSIKAKKIMNYRSEIDGLRAIAVIPVILFHAELSLFSGGFVGVDVFFVVSGYLITSIILGELADNNFSLINFYERRARRILPALFFVVLCCVLPALFILLPIDLVDFGKSLIAIPTFLSNVLFWSERGYFGGATELKPLIHTWSLAVEEQFYVIFPIVLIGLWKFSRSWIGPFLLITITVSLFLSWFLTDLHFETAFYLPFSRAWELMLGAAVAYFSKEVAIFSKLYGANLSIIGLLLIFYAVFFFDQTTVFPGISAMVPVMGTLLIIIAYPKNNLVFRTLSSPVLVKIGLLSYSLYLWHQPVFVFMRHLNLSEHIAVIGIPLSFILSMFTYRFIETPFRDRIRFPQIKIFMYSVMVSLLCIIIGIFLIVNDGFSSRFSEADQKIKSIY
jgi:peptidoglycan/LPS O-acetylase OafA/YrhL